MARPIGITPTLTGKDAKRILKRMNEPPTEKDKTFSKKLKELSEKRTVPFKTGYENKNTEK
ncbi:hypothetical protein [Methanobrevibacter sp. DSM 116169]|uniref:hypothetical protein n=1 Tax=Methanobrevibacter sp. DSM 116169 TaxID=3242727 RepID=UPI0038FC81E7